MSRKDSKGMFAAVLSQLNDAKEDGAPEVRSSSPHLLKVAAGVRQIQERSEAAEKLLRAGEQIVELDPDLVRPSSIHDRYDDAYEADAVAEIAASMSERGQIVPGLVRPVRDEEGAYQIVYGRRRLAAAKRLGIKFKTVVRDLTDEQAVIFQGEENTAREDLSFIEKCVFALAQQEAGFRRDTICASLSTGKSHVSEMIAIAAEIPNGLLRSIGKAPGVGRPRWAALVSKLSTPGESNWNEVVSSPGFRLLPSAERFEVVFKVLTTKSAARSIANSKAWSSADQAVRVSVKSTPKRAVVTYEARDGVRFADYVAGRLEALYEDFLKAKNRSTGD
ncbi:MAG: plasmid partitioning protein RepB [Mesorhizobium sp.]|nr:MAG: plasmid partitioning protein RepB [Mesorhizobium sp.]TJV68194.1 MAG: plasmid partitioning protein RepB [Mesorhizobium sp.]